MSAINRSAISMLSNTSVGMSDPRSLIGARTSTGNWSSPPVPSRSFTASMMPLRMISVWSQLASGCSLSFIGPMMKTSGRTVFDRLAILTCGLDAQLANSIATHKHYPCDPQSGISPNDSTLALFDELDDLSDFFGLRQFFLHGFDGLTRVVFGTINQAEGFFDELHTFGRKILAFQADQINSANLGWIAIGDHERWNVLDNFGAAAGDGEPSDPAKLMYGCEATHYRVVSHLNVAG